MFKIKIYSLLCILFTSAYIFAEEEVQEQEQDSCPPALTISDLLDTALKNHPETQATWWKANQAAAALGKAKSINYPSLSLRSELAHGYTYKFVNGPETRYTKAKAELILSYLLFDFGERRASIASAREALEAAEWRSDWTIQKIMSKVFTQTYEYWNAQEVLQARLKSLEDIKSNLKAAEELYKSGLRSVTDVYAIKTTLTEAQMSIAQQRAQTDIARGKLAVSVGSPADTQLELAPLGENVPVCVLECDWEELVKLAQFRRADYLAKRSELAQKIAYAKKVARSYDPKVMLRGNTGYDRYFSDKNHSFEYRVSLNLDYPIFTGFEDIYSKRAAIADVQATEADLDQMEQDIGLEILIACRQVKAAREVLSLSDTNLQNARHTYDGVLEKYKAGTQSIFDLTKAQQMLSDARIKNTEARTKFFVAIAQLAFAVGTLGDQTEDTCLE